MSVKQATALRRIHEILINAPHPTHQDELLAILHNSNCRAYTKWTEGDRAAIKIGNAMGLKPKEIAAMLHRSAGAVRSEIKRGKP